MRLQRFTVCAEKRSKRFESSSTELGRGGLMSDKKRVLVLSGGGSKGSYQAGVLSYLMTEKKDRWNAHIGVSVGAINCAQVAQYPDEKGDQCVDDLLNFWKKLRTKDVYKGWFFGKVSALWKPSVYNSLPLREYLEPKISRDRILATGKQLQVGVVSMDTGRYRMFTEQDEEILSGVLASAAYPVMLLTVPIQGEQWSDGGIRNVTPLAAAFALGATDIDVVMCTPPESRWEPMKKPNAIDNLGRMLDVMVDEIIETDLKLALAYNELARHGLIPGKRHANIRLFRPETTLPGDSLDFDNHIQEKIERGWEDARRICAE